MKKIMNMWPYYSGRDLEGAITFLNDIQSLKWIRNLNIWQYLLEKAVG